MVQCTHMNDELILRVVFFQTESGREPVREWLLELGKDDRKAVGEDIKLVQLRWPLGLPLVRKLERDLWEVRSQLAGGRIARTCFTVKAGEMSLLHGFIKKTQKISLRDLELARQRKNLWIDR